VLFVGRLRDNGQLPNVARVEVRLYASLALTGEGHATDRAVMLGLMGFVPAAARSRRRRGGACRGAGRAMADAGRRDRHRL
jgi:L-serine deaminase